VNRVADQQKGRTCIRLNQQAPAPATEAVRRAPGLVEATRCEPPNRGAGQKNARSRLWRQTSQAVGASKPAVGIRQPKAEGGMAFYWTDLAPDIVNLGRGRDRVHLIVGPHWEFCHPMSIMGSYMQLPPLGIGTS